MLKNREYIFFLTASLATACSGQGYNTTPGISGTVVSTAGTNITGAQVTVNGRTVVTDQAGVFFMDSGVDANNTVAMQVQAAGYPDAVRRIVMPKGAIYDIKFTLRPVDQTQTFALPGGNDTAQFSIARDGASAALSISANALVDAAGNLAAGNANLNLTFWSPVDDISTAPGVMLASNGNHEATTRQISLLSYGMVDIDIEQNGNDLQVAPGAVLQLNLVTTEARRQALSGRTGVSTMPTLWTLNPNTGLWDQDTGDSTFDMTTGTLVATLDHLSTKNSDEPYTETGPSVGDSACITGRAYGGCGQPLAGAVITLNVANSQLGPGIPTNWTFTTDSTGSFKANVVPGGHNNYYASATWNGHKTDMTQTPVDPQLQFVTYGPASPTYPRLIFAPMNCSDISGQCQNAACACFNDPSDPGGCMEQLEADDPADVNGYNPCWVNPLGSNWLGPCFNDQMTGSSVDTHYNTVWEYHTTTDLCGNCWPILDMVFKDVAGDQTSGCTGNGSNGQGCCPTTLSPGMYNICTDTSSPYRKTLGQVCEVATDTCCGTTSATGIQCADNVCVPSSDPT